MRIENLAAVVTLSASVALSFTALGCSGSAPTTTGMKILFSGKDATTASAGDALTLSVVATRSDGTTAPVPAGTQVTYTLPATVTALDASSTAPSPLPAFGAAPTAIFIQNPGRPDRAADLANVLFVVDAGTQAGGTVTVSAMSGGIATATSSLTISATPSGDATRGAITYGSSGAACAACHGATGHGSPPDASGTTYTMEGMQYSYPAPGLNAESGNVAGDPAWTPALLAMAARADMDNDGLTLRTPMPDWLTDTDHGTGAVLNTQDFADIYAFLATQNN